MKNRSGMIFSAVVTVLIVAVLIIIIATFNRKGEQQNDLPNETPVTDEEDTKVEDEEESQETVNQDVQEEAQEEVDESQAVSVWTTSNLNLRKTADKDGEVIKVISNGTEIQKYKEENGWAYVKCGEDMGYVSTQYIASDKPEEPKEATQATTSKVEAIPGQHRDPNSAVVVIDPGHQLRGDSKKEPNGPGSSSMKARVTSGTTGVATGVAEYILNLEISLKLKTELENRGYTVYMTRSTHDVNISNKERAEYATSVGADIAVRIHGNGSSNSSVHGAEAYCPSSGNAYVGHLANASKSLSQCIVNAYCSATGFKNRGVFASDTMTGINWSTVPVTILEMGYMSNSGDDTKMQDATMQNNMVQGIANGIDKYFGF